ncbi:hypothetical protein ABPG72_020081 [Tetrahymena utriculariae]
MESSSHLGQHMAVEELHPSPDFDLAEQLDRSAVLQQHSQPNQSKIKQNNYNTMNAESQSSSSPNKRSHTEEVISIEEFSKIAPNVKALYQLCILQGYYAPNNAAMKWLLSKYIEQKLPVLKQVKKCPQYVKITKQECISVINKYCPALQPDLRHDLVWLKDIAYTVCDGKEDVFSAFRNRLQYSSSHQSQSSIQFKLPLPIDDNIKLKLAQQFKPERLATSKVLNKLRDKMEESLINCGICLENKPPLCYTMCCQQPLHRQCSERITNQRCPYCKKTNLSISTKIYDYSRAYTLLN